MQLSSQGALHDEIDFEFLGNLSGDPYIVHTNIFTQGKVNREQQFYVCFMVDNIPLRVFDKNEAIGVPFPNSQAMRVYSSIWNADNWATQGGRVKTDCTKAHFTASYKNFNANACVWSSNNTSSCGSNTNSMTSTATWMNRQLYVKRLKWVQKNAHNYCTDFKRFPQGLTPECNQSSLH
ncbi:hypothetical protein TEA_024003 [Camellia sinensis var. sinensis]|uniref:xyloglucan:xyloglucosyl transferase n=1 Tax=Camellia sinensis var. sinensis TaxID=542762 RepID=A0A4S4DV33_CAMSN|nr:hypothetical protein TEA_024003 [Camellia sinensis var. sinensis]